MKEQKDKVVCKEGLEVNFFKNICFFFKNYVIIQMIILCLVQS